MNLPVDFGIRDNPGVERYRILDLDLGNHIQ